MNMCYIFGAADGLPKKFKREKGDLIIAADAGILHLKKLQIEPDIVLGDFDSLGYVPDFKNIIKHPVMKNDTDTLLAVKTAIKNGYKNIILYGCTGKRIDHTMANFQTLAYISKQHCQGLLCGDDYVATTLTNGEISFNSISNGTISIFSNVETSKGIYLKGLLYPLNNYDMTFDFPIGVSNEFIGEKSLVKVTDGTITVIWNGDISDINTFTQF